MCGQHESTGQTSMKFLLLSQGTCHVGHPFPEIFHQAGHMWHFSTFMLKGKSLSALASSWAQNPLLLLLFLNSLKLDILYMQVNSIVNYSPKYISQTTVRKLKSKLNSPDWHFKEILNGNIKSYQTWKSITCYHSGKTNPPITLDFIWYCKHC